MKLHHEDLYPLSVADLFAVFTDRAFYEERFASAGGETEFVHFGPRGGRFIIDVRRHVQIPPGTHIPALAKKFVRDTNVLHTVIEWDLTKGDAYRGAYRFAIERVPVDADGHMRLEPRASGCASRVEMTVRCSIPLVGGKIAEMVGERAERSLKRDYEITCGYLVAKGIVPA